MRPRPIAINSTRVLWLALTFVACSQDARVPDVAAADCAPKCTISVDTVWLSDSSHKDITIGYSPLELGDSLLLVDMYRNGQITVLDRVRNTIGFVGRKGSGPGEYSSISAIGVDDAGQLRVFDRRRVTVLDASLGFAHTASLPFIVEQGAVLSNGSAVVDGHRVIGDSIFTMHLLDAKGQVVNSFGKAGATESFSVTVARGRDNSAWAARRINDAPVYEIQRWDPRTGTAIQTIRDEPTWFAWTPRKPSPDAIACNGGRGDRAACERSADAPRAPHPAMPAIFDMWESPDGLLWIISIKADARWQEAPAADRGQRLDSVLEVRDAVSGLLIGSVEFDGALTGFTNRGNIMSHAMNVRDEPVHALLKVTLTRPRPR